MANGFGQQLLGEFRAGRELGRDIRGIAQTGFTPQEQIAEVTRKRQAFQDQAAEANVARFLEEDNLRSIGITALQLSNIADPRQQDEFVRRKITELERTGGRGVTDLREFLAIPDELRAQTLLGAVQVARDAGALERAPQAPTPAALKRFTGFRPGTEDPTTFVLDPSAPGGFRDIGVEPLPRQQPPEQTQTVTLPDGTQVQLRTGPSEADLSRGAKTGLQREVIEETERIDRIDEIIENLEENPTALDFFSRIEAGLTDVQLQARGLLGDVSPERLERRVVRDEIVIPLRNEALLFRRAITGAAGAAKEMAEILAAGLNETTPFPILLNRARQIRDVLSRTRFYKQKVLDEGLGGSFLDPNSGKIRRMDELWALDRKARRASDKRFRELRRKNKDAPRSAIIAAMVDEGLLDANGEVPTVE